MSNDMNDEGLDLDEASFDEFEKKKGTLADLWRDNPMVKVGVVVAAAAAIFGTIILFGGQKVPIDPSMVPEGSDVSAPPGTQEATPAYVEAVQQENDARTEAAQKDGGSSLPTPINPPGSLLTLTDEAPPEEDPLQRWRKLQEERLQREMVRSETVAPETASATPEDTGHAEAVQAMADAMSQQMQSILESRNQPKAVNFKTMTPASWLEKMNQQSAEAEQAQAEAEKAAQDEITEVILYPAGRIAYAQILIEANSDVPGPVLAQIASGPLTGSRILGSFSREKELLTLNFNTVIVDGVSISISGIAIDPATTLPAVATDVDHHYLQRVVLPMAAAFVEGMASAIAETGRTDVTVSGEAVATETEEASNDQQVATGVEEAGQELSEIINETADEIEVTVRVEAGTPIGVLFLEPVVRPADQL